MVVGIGFFLVDPGERPHPDIKDVGLVVNFDFPAAIEDYMQAVKAARFSVCFFGG